MPMIIRYGRALLLFFMVGCQSVTVFQQKAAEPDLRREFQQATSFLKEHEYQKAAQVYLGISIAYPQHSRAEEAAILGKELQSLVSINESLSASKETSMKNLKEMTQEVKRLSDENAKLEQFANENKTLHSQLRQVEEQVKELESLEKENHRLHFDIDQLKQSLKEFQKIEQEMKRPVESPLQPQEGTP